MTVISSGASEYVAFLVGSSILPSLVYGINSTLVIMTLGLLWNRRKGEDQKRSIFMSGYIVLVSALCTLHWVMSCMAEGHSLAALVDRSQGAGTLQGRLRITFLEGLAVAVPYVILTLLTDALLLWRCWVLYAGCSGAVRWITWTLFLILSLSLIVFGVLLVFKGKISRWSWVTIGHPTSVLATNVIFTSLAVGRLLFHQRRLKKMLGGGKYGAFQYTTIAAMIVESASINVVFQSLALISVFYPRGMNLIFNVNLLGQTQVLSTLLIIFRVARGTAWTEHTSREVMSRLKFRSSSSRGSSEGGLGLLATGQSTTLVAGSHFGSTQHTLHA